MSLQAIILSLLDGISDPLIRSDIASTIYFLRDMYISGRISNDELKAELTNIVNEILDATQPDLLPDEKKKKVDMLANQLFRAIKMETLRRRMYTKYRPSYRSLPT